MVVSVWVLILSFYVGNGGGSVIIDNIVSRDECLRVQNVMREDSYNVKSSRCVEVFKLK